MITTNDIFQMISLSKMKVDFSYQREADEKRVRSLANKWDPMKANIIHVSHRADGYYYILDGNHTRLAAEINGVNELPCRVHENLTVSDEAHIFYELNSSQKKPKFNEMLKARAAAGNEPDKSYLQVLDESKIPYSLTGSHNGLRVRCHGALMAVYKKANYDSMLRALKTAYKAADGREEFLQIGYFTGMCLLIVLHPEVNDEHLIKAVKKATSSKIREISDIYKRAITGGVISTTNYYMKAYIDVYNKGLRKGKIYLTEVTNNG